MFRSSIFPFVLCITAYLAVNNYLCLIRANASNYLQAEVSIFKIENDALKIFKIDSSKVKDTSTWKYLILNTNLGVLTSSPIKADAFNNICSLPHSVNIPNQEIWYQRFMQIKDTIFLRLTADDGAQVWQDERKVNSLNGRFYKLWPTFGNSNIVIRVLNNAVSGGLKSTNFVKPEGVDVIFKDEQESDDYFNIRRIDSIKKQLAINPTQEFQCKDSTEVRFTFWGDSQGGWDTFNRVAKCISQLDADFTIGLGDLTSNGSLSSEWIKLLNALGKMPLNLPKYLIPGNHDYDGYYDDLVPINYQRIILGNESKDSYFTWRAGNVLFISLDPNRNFPLEIDEAQTTWADSILSQSLAEPIQWRIILIHQPPYGQGWKDYEGDIFIRNWIDSRAEKYKIDFVLSGHVHDYERLSKVYGKQFTHFIVSGGAGGGLEPPESNLFPVMDKVIKRHHFCKLDLKENDANLQMFDLHGQVMDSLKFTK